jgi:hypothetical protein
MGAHMGYGGRVVGETLRCPFHGFCFDSRGTCTSTPYGSRPPRVRARAREIREHGGVVMMWHAADGSPPSWEVPVLEPAGYGRLRTHLWPRLRSHPQETTENSVDLGHLSVVHGYREVEMVGALRLEGPYLNARYVIERRNPFLPGLPPLEAIFDIHVHGLGYSFIQVEVPQQGLKSRHFVFATPLDGEHIALRAAIALDESTFEPARVAKPFAVLPRKVASEIVGSLALRAYIHDIAQDFDIWEHKRYIQPPALAEGDGPVGRYRRWCQQFYS